MATVVAITEAVGSSMKLRLQLIFLLSRGRLDLVWAEVSVQRSYILGEKVEQSETRSFSRSSAEAPDAA